MAKMFYTMEETKAALGKNEEDVKQLAREGRLREFRDGPRLMFKADQVEQVKAELASGGAADDGLSLAPAEDAPLPLAGDSSMGGTGVTGAVGGKKEDTFADIGLSGSLGGSAAGSKAGTSIGSPALTGSGIGTGAGGTRGGITIFDVDDSQKADPSAQTAINAGVGEQPGMESVGSGSGLLDLTRESDDTSLGAVFDELNPPAAGRRGPQSQVATMETQAGTDIGMPAIDRSRTSLAAPMYVEEPDAVATALGAAAVVATIGLFFAAFVLISTILGYRPEILDSLDRSQSGNLYFLGLVGATIVVGIAAYFVGKMGRK